MEKTKKSCCSNNSSSNDFFKKVKIYIFSLIGIIIFFIPIKINNELETIIYHISYFLENEASPIIQRRFIFYRR